jgi:hypothetical protein
LAARTRESEMAQGVGDARDSVARLALEAAQAGEKVRAIQDWAGRRQVLHDTHAAAQAAEDAAKAAEGPARDAALAKAREGYAAVEADLKAFRKFVEDERKDINRQAGPENDPQGAQRRLNGLKTAVKAKKDQAIEKIKAIRSVIVAGRDCYRDVDQAPVEEYINGTLNPKILALGGALEGAIASDMQGPGDVLDKLLDVPLDKPDKTAAATAPTTQSLGALWVCEKPEITHGSNITIGESGANWTVKMEGQTGTGKVTWQGVKSEFREGEKVELTMSAKGTPPGVAMGKFYTNCADAKPTVWDNEVGSGRNKDEKGKPTASLVFKFTPPSAGEAYIQVVANQFDSGGATVGTATWKYQKKGP